MGTQYLAAQLPRPKKDNLAHILGVNMLGVYMHLDICSRK